MNTCNEHRLDPLARLLLSVKRLILWIIVLVTMVIPAAAEQLWFAPLPNTPTPHGFVTNPDFPTLFLSKVPWAKALKRTDVFLISGRYVQTGPEDELRRMFRYLKNHNVGLAVRLNVVEAYGCGQGIEGMVYGPNVNYTIIERMKLLGAEVTDVLGDEPLSFGHYARGAKACKYSIERVAQSFGRAVRQVRAFYPAARVSDVEASSVLQSLPELGSWFDLLKREMGTAQPMTFHFDVQWQKPWAGMAPRIAATAKQHGFGFGVLYRGTGEQTSDAAWLAAAKAHIAQWERVVTARPDHVVIQSWNKHPSHLLPEADPTTLTSLVNWYCDQSTIRPTCR